MDLFEFAKEHGLELYCELSGLWGGYVSYFKNADIRHDGRLIIIVGSGETKDEALADYARQIRGKSIVSGFGIAMKNDVIVPEDLAHVPGGKGNTMTREQLAKKLDGREYGCDIDMPEIKEIGKAGLIIVYGASDDMVEFRGSTNREFEACGGIEIPINFNGEPYSRECGSLDCPHEKEEISKCETIEAKWDHNGFLWWIESEIPHSHFVIKEDGKNYCRGIVYNVSDVEGK